jgi:hypothetical protein
MEELTEEEINCNKEMIEQELEALRMTLNSHEYSETVNESGHKEYGSVNLKIRP